MTAPLLKSKQAAPFIDWNTLDEMEAIVRLCERLGVSLRVDSDGNLKATGNTKAARLYLADIAARYRPAIIAHRLGLAAPKISDAEDDHNIIANAQALDAVIGEYTAAAGLPAEYRDGLLATRRKMPAALLVQNLCAFRCWLFEVKDRDAQRQAGR